MMGEIGSSHRRMVNFQNYASKNRTVEKEKDGIIFLSYLHGKNIDA